MTAAKRPSATLSGIKDATDRERPRGPFRCTHCGFGTSKWDEINNHLFADHARPQSPFKPCSTCRYKRVMPEAGTPFCLMFGNMNLWEARSAFCGRYGDAWRAKEPEGFAAVPMVDRVLG